MRPVGRQVYVLGYSFLELYLLFVKHISFDIMKALFLNILDDSSFTDLDIAMFVYYLRLKTFLVRTVFSRNAYEIREFH